MNDEAFQKTRDSIDKLRFQNQIVATWYEDKPIAFMEGAEWMWDEISSTVETNVSEMNGYVEMQDLKIRKLKDEKQRLREALLCVQAFASDYWKDENGVPINQMTEIVDEALKQGGAERE